MLAVVFTKSKGQGGQDPEINDTFAERLGAISNKTVDGAVAEGVDGAVAGAVTPGVDAAVRDLIDGKVDEPE